MGRDIHWVIERRHPRGDWHAVAAKTELAIAAMTQPNWPHGIDFGAPERVLGHRDYEVFEMLSGVQFGEGGGETCSAQIAIQGLPEDAGDYVTSDIAGDPEIHSRGCIPLGALADAAARPDHPAVAELASRLADGGPHASDAQALLSLLKERHGSLLAVLGNPDVAGTVLVARDAENQPVSTSAHGRIDRARLFAGLEPVGAQSVRLLIGYDN